MKTNIKTVVTLSAMLGTLGGAHQAHGSVFTKIRDAATHPFVMVGKKVDQIGDIPKKIDGAADAGANAANQLAASTPEIAAQTTAALNAAQAAAEQAQQAVKNAGEAAAQGKSTMRMLGFPLAILLWGLVSLVAIKTSQAIKRF